jgi:hypothetical protein
MGSPKSELTVRDEALCEHVHWKPELVALDCYGERFEARFKLEADRVVTLIGVLVDFADRGQFKIAKTHLGRAL